ncbi:hypothetical protein [Caldicellulosiruptor acetigenus]|uniref:Lipoprotein n=1 Tax=Caldicellulosiruptor acetigenus 6A TaxID=632516 RepID=G2PVH6_9FIRM|nr:hypothetical protein [Caldicellulosiruptor acetigenus]AEM74576.1 hypothetical protein Calla_2007 [Caldicellulosiruptor acetigenus 6A]
MKKFLIMILTIGIIFFSGCAKFSNISETNFKSSSQFNITSSKKVTYNAERNPFFFKESISKVEYKGKFLFDDLVEKNVKLNIIKKANLKYGELYELKLEPIEGIPDERLSLGYFYVQKDKIYKIDPTKENLSKLKTREELPNDSVIVCQDKEIKDSLSENKRGWHRYLRVERDKREYHAYNNQVETGYYETFIWEKNKGLISYRSGYGAERDSIELQIKDK